MSAHRRGTSVRSIRCIRCRTERWCSSASGLPEATAVLPPNTGPGARRRADPH
jgi:hypothetical protein